MAKILFNDELFNISEAALNTASERIMRVLSSVMNGIGATINFGGTTYNIDSTKLSTATNSFISHLGTVSGSGMKVSVGGVEYSIDSSKMSNAVSQIHAVLSGLHSGGNSSLEVILEEGQYDFEFNESFRMYMSRRADWFSLQEGETYKVIWDGEEYTVEAYRYTFNGYDAVFLGNEGYMKGESTALVEPFCIYRLFANDYCFLATFDTSTSHTVAIYKVVSGGGDSGLEMNEYGFYFGVPYVASTNGTKLTMIFYADGSSYTKQEEGGEIVTEWTNKAGTFEYEMNKITSGENAYVYNVTDNGTKIYQEGSDIPFVLYAPKYDDTYPIQWNTMAVVGNPTVMVGGVPLIKVSNLTPSAEELSTATITANMGGQELVLTCTGTEVKGNYIGATFEHASIGSLLVISAKRAGTLDGAAIPEAGLYVVNASILGYDLDCTLNIATSNGLVMNQYGFYFDVPYVYYDEAMQTTFNMVFHADGSADYVIIPDSSAQYSVNYPAEDVTYSQNQVEMRSAGELYTCVFLDNGTKFDMGQGQVFTLRAPKYDDTYPIQFNSRQVINNPAFTFSDVPMVKVSNLTPSMEELSNATLIINFDGADLVFTRMQSYEDNGASLIFFGNDTVGVDDFLMVSSASPTTLNSGDIIPEAGLYFINFADVNADCRLELAPSNTTTITWDGNTEGLVSSNDGCYYKVSDLILTEEQVKNSVVEMSTGEIITIKDLWDNVVISENIIACELFIVTRINNSKLYDLIFPEAGIYFIKIDNNFLTSMTFPS